MVVTPPTPHAQLNIKGIKEHLFLLKRMEEESYEYNHDISSTEEKLFSYLHKLQIKTESFFISVVTKNKEDFLDKFPDFLEDLTKILDQLI